MLTVSLIVQFIAAGIERFLPAMWSGHRVGGLGQLRFAAPHRHLRFSPAAGVHAAEGLRMAGPVNHQPTGLAHSEQT